MVASCPKQYLTTCVGILFSLVAFHIITLLKNDMKENINPFHRAGRGIHTLLSNEIQCSAHFPNMAQLLDQLSLFTGLIFPQITVHCASQDIVMAVKRQNDSGRQLLASVHNPVQVRLAVL